MRLQDQYVNLTADSLNLTATSPNWFIHSGSGQDAINVSQAGGNNILDGGTGSNFLTGGAGNDTFYLDSRNAAAPIFSTVAGFHSGDNVTVWGVNASNFTVIKLDNQGAVGFTGLTSFHHTRPLEHQFRPGRLYQRGPDQWPIVQFLRHHARPSWPARQPVFHHPCNVIVETHSNLRGHAACWKEQ